MSLLKALYGKKCRGRTNWDNIVDNITLGPELLNEMEQAIIKIRHNLKISQDKHKSYVDSKITPTEFKVGDHEYLWVKPKRISLKMGMCAKLAP